MTNRKAMSNRRRCAHHRLVARALRDRPDLVDEARVVVRDWKRRSNHVAVAEEWECLLSLPIEQLRREITRRTPDADRLRASSPFALTATRVVSADQRAQLWQKVKRPTRIAHGKS